MDNLTQNPLADGQPTIDGVALFECTPVIPNSAISSPGTSAISEVSPTPNTGSSQTPSPSQPQGNLANHSILVEDECMLVEYVGKDKLFDCMCRRTYNTLEALQRHSLSCDKIVDGINRVISKFMCNKCVSQFDSFRAVATHYGRCKRLRCPYCKTSFPTKIGLGQHKRKRHSALLYEESASPSVPRWSPSEFGLLVEAEAKVQLQMESSEELDPELSCGVLNYASHNEAVYNEIKSRYPDFNRSLQAVIGKRTHGDVNTFLDQVRVKKLKLAQERDDERAIVTTSLSSSCLPQSEDSSLADSRSSRCCSCLDEVNQAIDSHLASLAKETSAILKSQFLVDVRAGLENYNTQGLKQAMGSAPARRQTQMGPSAEDENFRSQRGKKGKEKVHERANTRRIFETQGLKRCLQHLQNPSKAGKCTRETVDMFQAVFEDSGSTDEGPFRAKPALNDPHLTHKRVQPAEVEEQLRRLQKGTAPGPDGVRTEDLKSLKSSDWACLFNIFLVHRDVPSDLKVNRTTLIPKKADPGPGDWRPITISSIIDRLFAKVLEARLNKIVDLESTQRGFIKDLDGCGENIITYGGLMRYSRKHSKSLVVVSLDLAKAFDSVKYSSIKRALTRMGLDSMSIELMTNLCHGHKTVLEHEGGSCSVELKRGVRQGWPLSPLLFLIVVDEVLCSLDDADGFQIEGPMYSSLSISGAAFADDLILYSSSEIGMRKNLDATVEWCDQRGMKINATKSSVTWLRAVPKAKKVVVTPIDLPVKGVSIPNVGDSFERVLGVQMHQTGQVDHRGDKLQKDLELVRNSSLRPTQKLKMITDCLIPSIKYRLVYGFANMGACVQVDKILKKTVKEILHLPKYTSDLALYITKAQGGLGVPRLADSVLISQVSLTYRMQKSKNVTTCILADTAILAKANKHYSKLLDGAYISEDQIEPLKDLLRAKRAFDFAFTAQGAGSPLFRSAPRLFLDNPRSRKWKDRDVIQALKMRLDILMTRDVIKRNTPNSDRYDTICRGCHKYTERLGHIIGKCETTQHNRVARHDNLCSYVEKLLKGLPNAQSLTIERERTHILSRGQNDSSPLNATLRPDLTVESSSHVALIEVSVVFESTYGHQNLEHEASLERVRLEKLAKYDKLRKQIQTASGKKCNINTLIVGCRGGWLKSNEKVLDGVGPKLTDLDMNSLVERAVRGSLITYGRFIHATREPLVKMLE